MEIKIKLNHVLLQILLWPLYAPYAGIMKLVRHIGENTCSEASAKTKMNFWGEFSVMTALCGGIMQVFILIVVQSGYITLPLFYVYGMLLTLGIKQHKKYEKIYRGGFEK